MIENPAYQDAYPAIPASGLKSFGAASPLYAPGGALAVGFDGPPRPPCRVRRIRPIRRSPSRCRPPSPAILDGADPRAELTKAAKAIDAGYRRTTTVTRPSAATSAVRPALREDRPPAIPTIPDREGAEHDCADCDLDRPAETARPRRLIGARWQELLMLLPACAIIAGFLLLPFILSFPMSLTNRRLIPAGPFRRARQLRGR